MATVRLLVFHYITRPHGFRFDPAGMRDLLGPRLDKLSRGEVSVASSEILLGDPF